MTLKMLGAETESAAKPSTGMNSHSEGSGSRATGDAAHAEGTTCVASGTNSHAEGLNTTASGTTAHAEGNSTSASSYSHAEGSSCIANGLYAHAEGSACTASGDKSHAEGNTSTAAGQNSHAQGTYAKATRIAQHAMAGGRFATDGDSQAISLVTMAVTNSATPSVPTVGQGSVATVATDASVLTCPASRGFRFRVEIIARNIATGAGEYAGWTITGTMVRGSTGDARFLGTPVAVTESDAGASAWTVGLSIDTTNATYNYLMIMVTGETGKTIRWVATIYATEVG